MICDYCGREAGHLLGDVQDHLMCCKGIKEGEMFKDTKTILEGLQKPTWEGEMDIENLERSLRHTIGNLMQDLYPLLKLGILLQEDRVEEWLNADQENAALKKRVEEQIQELSKLGDQLHELELELKGTIEGMITR